MKNIIYSILVMSLLTSCSKYPDPSVEITSGYNLGITGSFQRAIAGDFLKDSLSIQLYNQKSLPTGMRVEFSILTGNGELSTPNTTVENSGFAYTRWKLGNKNNTQKVKASLYSKEGNLLSTSTFVALAFNPDKWDTVSEQFDSYMWDLMADTVNNLSFMISGGQLYRQIDNYFNWVAENNSYLGGLHSIEIDGNNNLFAFNSIGDLYISRDKGRIWNQCTSPFSGYYYNMGFTISNNNYIWVSASGSKLYCSKDDGFSWQDASTGLMDSDGIGEIYKHPDGTLFFRTTNYRLYKSDDDGSSWLPVPTLDRADKLFITADGELLIYAFNSEHRILKSTDKGEHFTEIYSVATNSWASNLNFFNFYKGTFYILIPGKGILKTTDLIHFEEFWNNPELVNLFIDHHGVLLAKSLNNSIYYRKNI